MQTPLIRKYRSFQSPWDVYRNVHANSSVSFFLDSPSYRPPDQSYSYIGLDPFLEVVLEDQHDQVKVTGEIEATYPASDVLGVLRDLMKKYPTQKNFKPFFTGGAVGFFSYEMAQYFDQVRFREKPTSKTPHLFFAFYHDLIVYDHRKKCYYLITHYPSSKSIAREQSQKAWAREKIDRLKSFIDKPVKKETEFSLKKFHPEIKRQDFVEKIERAQEYIRAGDIYQANLSQRFLFESEGSSLKLYEDLRKINPSPFASFLKIRDLEVVSSSPERLVSKRGRRCETRPIAGTRPLKNKKQNIKKAQKDFLSNEKERAEHIMLVDLERNDLGRVCNFKSVKVEEMMKIEKYSHVMHIVSKITGKLDSDKDVFDLIRAMFPGGTITGCPKIRCMEIIDELEPSKRGLYTGSIGYLDFNGDMDLNIVIRTLVLKQNQGHLQVGAGIVHDSNPEKEYEETLHKGEALTEALVQASL